MLVGDKVGKLMCLPLGNTSERGKGQGASVKHKASEAHRFGRKLCEIEASCDHELFEIIRTKIERSAYMWEKSSPCSKLPILNAEKTEYAKKCEEKNERRE
jgi:hypothetical protein